MFESSTAVGSGNYVMTILDKDFGFLVEEDPVIGTKICVFPLFWQLTHVRFPLFVSKPPPGLLHKSDVSQFVQKLGPMFEKSTFHYKVCLELQTLVAVGKMRHSFFSSIAQRIFEKSSLNLVNTKFLRLEEISLQNHKFPISYIEFVWLLLLHNQHTNHTKRKTTNNIPGVFGCDLYFFIFRSETFRIAVSKPTTAYQPVIFVCLVLSQQSFAQSYFSTVAMSFKSIFRRRSSGSRSKSKHRRRSSSKSSSKSSSREKRRSRSRSYSEPKEKSAWATARSLFDKDSRLSFSSPSTLKIPSPSAHSTHSAGRPTSLPFDSHSPRQGGVSSSTWSGSYSPRSYSTWSAGKFSPSRSISAMSGCYDQPATPAPVTLADVPNAPLAQSLVFLDLCSICLCARVSVRFNTLKNSACRILDFVDTWPYRDYQLTREILSTVLRRCPKLKFIRFNKVAEKNMTRAVMKSCRRLRGIEIDRDIHTKDQIIMSLTNSCRRLELFSSRLTLLSNQELAAFTNCDNLKHLELYLISGIDSDIRFGLVQVLQNCRKLATLKLSCFRGVRDALRILREEEFKSDLGTLELSQCHLGVTELAMIAQLFPDLRDLSVWRNFRITDLAMSILIGMYSLQVLDIRHTSITDIGLGILIGGNCSLPDLQLLRVGQKISPDFLVNLMIQYPLLKVTD